MKKTILSTFLILSILSSFGQKFDKNQIIIIKKVMGSTYIKNDKYLTLPQLVEISKSYPESFSEMKIARNNYFIAYTFSSIGGFCIGWPIGTIISGGDPNWILAGIGIGLVGISVPFSIAFNKHAKKAVDIYNSNLPITGYNKVNFNFGIVENGFGMRILF